MTVTLGYASYTDRRPLPRRLWNSNLVLLITMLLVGGATSASEALSSSSYTSTNRNGRTYSPLGHNGESVNAKMFNGKLKPLLQGDLPDRVMGADFIADTKLPTLLGDFKMRAYRVKQRDVEKFEEELGENFLTYRNNQVMEPIVLYHAENPPFGTSKKMAQDVPIRIHDQCLTSEVFGSQRCDCSEQLKMALEYVRENGGAVIYLQQEGRGIGLANKLAAYQLQDMGFDTVDANLHLGFPEDCRQYGVVPSVLKEMNIGSIKLLTNNPRKVERLTSLGVPISDTIPMVVPKVTEHNRKYLETKKERMNHRNFGSLLESSNAIVSRRDATADATNAVEVSMSLEDSTTASHDVVNHASSAFSSLHDDKILDDESQAGVMASQDGYCFGRESVEECIAAMARGEMVVVVDDMDRENEGDLIMAADLCTPMDMAKIVRYSSGVVCVGMEGKRMDELKLPAMCTNNEDPKGTAFSVTVDAAKQHGITTGISAGDRSKTVQLLANPQAKAVDFNRPGHLFPLRAREGGVLTRDGHTEAAVDLSRLAGLSPCGVLCEIVSEDNPTEMMRLPELKRFCRRHGFKMTSIVDLAQYRRETESAMAKHNGNQ